MKKNKMSIFKYGGNSELKRPGAGQGSNGQTQAPRIITRQKPKHHIGADKDCMRLTEKGFFCPTKFMFKQRSSSDVIGQDSDMITIDCRPYCQENCVSWLEQWLTFPPTVIRLHYLQAADAPGAKFSDVPIDAVCLDTLPEARLKSRSHTTVAIFVASEHKVPRRIRPPHWDDDDLALLDQHPAQWRSAVHNPRAVILSKLMPTLCKAMATSLLAIRIVVNFEDNGFLIDKISFPKEADQTWIRPGWLVQRLDDSTVECTLRL